MTQLKRAASAGSQGGVVRRCVVSALSRVAGKEETFPMTIHSISLIFEKPRVGICECCETFALLGKWMCMYEVSVARMLYFRQRMHVPYEDDV